MQQSTAPRVVVADDHAPTRLAVRHVLDAGGFELVAEASDADGALAGVLDHRPDLCLLDVLMPGDGISAAAAIAEQVPATAVVMFSVSTADEHLFAAIVAGAVGFLPKDMDWDRLPAALHAALTGEAAIPRGLVRRLVAEFSARQRHATAAAR